MSVAPNLTRGTVVVLSACAMLAAGAADLSAQTNRLSTPSLSCAATSNNWAEVRFCAGPSGAPAGFTLHWLTAEQLAAGPDGTKGTADDGTFYHEDECKAVFSAPDDMLAANECRTVRIGDVLRDNPSCNCPEALDCDTDYLFHGYANRTEADYASYMTPNLSCGTQPCVIGCTLTQGFFKNHFDVWSGHITSLQLGDVTYSAEQLLAIFDEPVRGNGLISLAHQLIAAKLNILGGADDAEVASAIAAADALIADNLIPPVGDGWIHPRETSALNEQLTAFNEGRLGPQHCDQYEPSY